MSDAGRAIPAQVSRPDALHVVLDHGRRLDLTRAFSGDLSEKPYARVQVCSPLSGERIEVSMSTLAALAQWCPQDVLDTEVAQSQLGLTPKELDDWLTRGFLIAETTVPELDAVRRRRDRLRGSGWESDALHHFAMSRWRHARGPVNQPIDEATRERDTEINLGRMIERHGPMPNAVHPRAISPGIALPEASIDSPLGNLLTNRHTTRLFDTDVALPAAALSRLLKLGFGAQGCRALPHDVELLKKYNPSGGALHSVEAYPLIMKVDGVAPGLYHYNVKEHSLGPLQAIEESVARERVQSLLAGQHWYQSAHVIVFMTARFERAFWKYRQHTKAYKSIFMDAGHISQTLYLGATELNLGAFVTMAVNDVQIEEMLDIDFAEEGVINVCGFGVRKAQGDEYAFAFEPFTNN